MMIMGNFKKMYIGAIENEQEAAYLYDKIAILVHGLKVIPHHTNIFNFRQKLTSNTASSKF